MADSTVTNTEKADCGIYVEANRKGPSRLLVEHVLEAAKRLSHRGGKLPGKGGAIYDGAGVCFGKPHAFLAQQKEFEALGALSEDQYGIGSFFLPTDSAEAAAQIAHIDSVANALRLKRIGDARQVPMQLGLLDETVRGTHPDMVQLAFAAADGTALTPAELDVALAKADRRLREEGVRTTCLSREYLLYKTMIGSNIGEFFSDLRDAEFMSDKGMFHMRHATNTKAFPENAQPFVASSIVLDADGNETAQTVAGGHNGEVNNDPYLTRMHAIRATETPDIAGDDARHYDKDLSDSGKAFGRMAQYAAKLGGIEDAMTTHRSCIFPKQRRVFSCAERMDGTEPPNLWCDRWADVPYLFRQGRKRQHRHRRQSGPG